MEIQYTGVTHTLQTAALAALIFAACALLPKLNYRSHLAKLPVFGGPAGGEKQRQAFLNSARKMYSDGYEQVSMLYYLGSLATNGWVVQELRLPHRIIRRRRQRCRASQSATRTAETARQCS